MDRTFYITHVGLTLYSEAHFGNYPTIHDIVDSVDMMSAICRTSSGDTEACNAKAFAAELLSEGISPTFFDLTAEGEDITLDPHQMEVRWNAMHMLGVELKGQTPQQFIIEKSKEDLMSRFPTFFDKERKIEIRLDGNEYVVKFYSAKE